MTTPSESPPADAAACAVRPTPDPPAVPPPTLLTAEDHQQAYAYFNDALFGGRLPPCLITLSEGRYRGYFKRQCFRSPGQADRVDEISMNPVTFNGLQDYLSTLVHEMCHLEQEHFGTPGKPPYHNVEWAGMMKRVGLQPRSTEKGHEKRETGRTVTHDIDPTGAFAAACARLLQDGFDLRYRYDPAPPRRDHTDDPDEQAATQRDEDRKRKKRESKTRFQCPGCGTNAWAKPTAKLACGACKQSLVILAPHPADLVVND